MIRLETYIKSDIELGKSIIKENGLHYKTGSGLLPDLNGEIICISIAFMYSSPIGCALIVDLDSYIKAHVFVKKDYRRLGFGSKLWRSVQKFIKKPVMLDKNGYKMNFWKHNGIDADEI